MMDLILMPCRETDKGDVSRGRGTKNYLRCYMPDVYADDR